MKRSPAAPRDYGLTEIQLARSEKPDSNVLIDDHADATGDGGIHPTRNVRGARRATAADRMHAAGTLTTAQLTAAREWHRLAETVALGLTADPASVRSSTHPAFRSHAPLAWVEANAKLARAARLAGPEGTRCLWTVLARGLTLAAAYAVLWPFGEVVSIRTAEMRVGKALSAALDRLATEWG